MSLRKLSRARSGAAIPAPKHVPPQGYPEFLLVDQNYNMFMAAMGMKRPMDTCALLDRTPADSPMVGRYPMKDGATLDLRLEEAGGNREVEALRAMQAPELALYPGKSGWQVRIGCEITKLTVYANWIPSDPSGFLERLVADGGVLNAAVSYPDYDDKRGLVRRGIRLKPVKKVWWPPGDVLGANSHVRKVKAECVEIDPVVTEKVKSPRNVTHLMVEATLDHSPLMVRRVFRVSMTDTVEDLRRAMLKAFGWEGWHLSSFYVGRRSIDDREHRDDVNPMPLSKLYESGVRKLRFRYDFGDCWDHTLKLKPATPAQIANQRWVQEAEGPDMVEDIGGTWGLQQLIEEYEAWAGSGGAERNEDDYSGMFEGGWRPDRNMWMG